MGPCVHQSEEGLCHDAANSSAPTQILPEHSSLAQVGIVANSTSLRGIPPGPQALVLTAPLAAHWAEVKSFCPGLPPVPRGPSCCRGPAGPHLLSHLSKRWLPSHRRDGAGAYGPAHRQGHPRLPEGCCEQDKRLGTRLGPLCPLHLEQSLVHSSCSRQSEGTGSL